MDNADNFKKRLDELHVAYEMTAGQFSFPCKRCGIGHIVISSSGVGGCTGDRCLKRLTFDDAIAICEGKTVSGNKQSNIADAADQVKLKIVSWGDFKNREFPVNAWRVGGFIPLSGITIIAAPSGEKKSWVVMAIARAVAEGHPFLGHPEFAVQQGKVLYIENETPQGEIQRRGKMVGFGQGIYFAESCPALDTDAGVNELFEMAVSQQIGLIIIDTFRSVVGLKEEKAEEVRAFFKRFNKFAVANITIVFTDHCRKPAHLESKTIPKKEQLFGSQDKLAAVHALIMVKSEKKSEEIFVHPLKLKAGKEREPFKILMKEEDDTVSFSFGGNFDEQELKIEQAKEFILTQLEEATEPMSTKDLIQALSGRVGKSNVESTLKEMREKKEVHFEKVGQKYLYRKLLREEEPDDGDEFDEPLIPLAELPDEPLGSRDASAGSPHKP